MNLEDRCVIRENKEYVAMINIVLHGFVQPMNAIRGLGMIHVLNIHRNRIGSVTPPNGAWTEYVGEGGGGGMAVEPRWLSWCLNGGDEVGDDEGGEGSSVVVVVKIEVAVVGVGQPREAAMEVVMAVVMTAVAASMVVWHHGNDEGCDMETMIVVDLWVFLVVLENQKTSVNPLSFLTCQALADIEVKVAVVGTAEPRWLSWCSNDGDEVGDDEGGEGSLDVVLVKMEVAAVGVGQPREAAMEVVMAMVMTVAAAAMVVWQRGDDEGGDVETMMVVDLGCRS
nr:hypothetical protein [Tanacetum cinerariifolium]